MKSKLKSGYFKMLIFQLQWLLLNVYYSFLCLAVQSGRGGGEFASLFLPLICLVYRSNYCSASLCWRDGELQENYKFSYSLTNNNNVAPMTCNSPNQVK